MPSIKILLVEDEQLIAADLKETLESLGYCVFAPLASGEEALAQVVVLQPDLVLMDIYLEGEIDGIEASAQIQAEFDIPVVFLTANSGREMLERIKAIHPFGYLLKPYDEKTLNITIDIALSRHQAEAEIRKALATAEIQSAEAVAHQRQKSEYLAMTAHEFRNPLVAIQFAAEMLQERGEQLSKTKQQKHVERIQAATATLNEMLDNVLLLEQVEGGNPLCERVLLDVVNFCREYIEALQLAVSERYVLTFAAPIARCLVHLDAKRFTQLLDNLFSNAIKYSPEGGLIRFTLAINPEEIILQVQDFGIGIPPDDHLQVFQAFYRASNVSQFSGNGLGLAIAKQCIDLHDGQIWIESALGRGTTVFVTLPR